MQKLFRNSTPGGERIKGIPIFIVFVLQCTVHTCYAQSIYGKWDTGLDHAVVQITQKGTAPVGTIVQSDDIHQIGTVVMEEIKPHPGGGFTCTIFDPKVERRFDARVHLTVDGRMRVKVSCCFGLYSETFYWQKH